MSIIARAALAWSLAATALVVAGTPADAAAVGDGSLVFAGTVEIPTFPCPPPSPDTYPCVGSFTASTAGTMRGLHGGSPWQLSLNAVTLGAFSYVDLLEPGVPCTEGRARGTTTLDTGSSGQAFGTYTTGTLARPIRSAAITYSFNWLREGVTAVLTIFDVTVTLQVDGIGSVTVLDDGTAHAVASFVPGADFGVPTGCMGGEPTRLRGSIAGTVAGVSVQP